MHITSKVKNKYHNTKKAWKSDIQFSKKYAKLRVKDTVLNSMHLYKAANKAFSQREEYMLRYLKDCIGNVLKKYADSENDGIADKNAPIWICWWTGIDNAPELVKQCVKSICNNAGTHTVYFIDQDNYNEFIDVPEYMYDKMVKGTMCLAHFADYLRIALLEKYGGLWLDATIYCSQKISDPYFEHPFFTLKSPYRESRYISKYQWVTFCLGGWRNNLFFTLIKEALEAYWKKNDYAIDYLFFDYIIYLAKENCAYINQIMDSVPENTPHRDDLQAAMNATLPAAMFNEVLNPNTDLYKLSWREHYAEYTSDGSLSVYGHFLRLKL